MIGMEQAGIAETINFILKKYHPDVQNKLVGVRHLICFSSILAGECKSEAGSVVRVLLTN